LASETGWQTGLLLGVSALARPREFQLGIRPPDDFVGDEVNEVRVTVQPAANFFPRQQHVRMRALGEHVLAYYRIEQAPPVEVFVFVFRLADVEVGINGRNELVGHHDDRSTMLRRGSQVLEQQKNAVYDCVFWHLSRLPNMSLAGLLTYH